MLKKALIFILLLISSVVYAGSLTPLHPDKAFHLTTKVTKNNMIEVRWTIAPQYYLYKKRFKFTVIPPSKVSLGNPAYPIGLKKQDNILGKYTVYKDHVIINIPALATKAGRFKLIVGYQGCAESGFCYPPTTKSVALALHAPTDVDSQQLTAIGGAELNPPLQAEHDKIANILKNSNFIVAILAFLGLGLLLTFTPCVLPLIPILSGIIVGQAEKITTRKAFSLSLVYVLSMSLTYAVAGVLVALVGSNLQAALQQPWVIVSFSLVFVLLALSLFGLYELRMPAALQNRLNQLSGQQQGGTYIGVAIMGVLSTLIVSPCVTAPLVGALTYIAQTGNVVFGGTALFALGLGMGLPLLIIGTSGGKLLPKAGVWMNTVKIAFGFMLIGMAIWLLQRVLSGELIMLLWAGLLIAVAVSMGVFVTATTRWQKISKGLGFVVVAYSVVLVFAAAKGLDSPLQPLTQIKQLFTKTAEKQVVTKPLFRRIKTVVDLHKVLAEAKQQQKLVMLDFYADWCVSCIIMEKNTFSDPKVRFALENFILVQADVTANDKFDKSLQEYLRVVAPPTIIFFQASGRELKPYRIVGEMSTKQFLQQVASLKNALKN